jgi:hypothetical protein
MISRQIARSELFRPQLNNTWKELPVAPGVRLR